MVSVCGVVSVPEGETESHVPLSSDDFVALTENVVGLAALIDKNWRTGVVLPVVATSENDVDENVSGLLPPP